MTSQLDDSSETDKLLMRMRSGDRTAFDQLFDRFRNQLRRAVELRFDSKLRQRLDASDIVQETQLEAFRRLDDFLTRQPMPFGLWLRKTAQQRLSNARRDHVRTKKRSVLRERPLPDRSSMMIAAPFLDPDVYASERIAREEYQRLVADAVAELEGRDREILLMRNVEGLTHREIAYVLDMNHAAVRQRYGRALLKLQQLLHQRGITESEG